MMMKDMANAMSGACHYAIIRSSRATADELYNDAIQIAQRLNLSDLPLHDEEIDEWMESAKTIEEAFPSESLFDLQHRSIEMLNLIVDKFYETGANNLSLLETGSVILDFVLAMDVLTELQTFDVKKRIESAKFNYQEDLMTIADAKKYQSSPQKVLTYCKNIFKWKE